MRMAKEQAAKIDMLLQELSLKEDNVQHRELQAASHSIVDCLLEGLNETRPEQFQKNFLVIAKAFNTELSRLLLVFLNEKQLTKKKYEQFVETNTMFENNIASFIRQLQVYGNKTPDITTENKS